MGAPGPLELTIILVIVLVIFGPRRLKNFGSELGNAIKGFRSAVKERDDKDKQVEEVSPSEESSTEETTKAEESPKEKHV